MSSTPARAEGENLLRVGVRSIVEKPKHVPLGKNTVYVLVPAKPLPSARPLIKPVKPNVIDNAVIQALTKMGCQRAMVGDSPTQVISVHYGRGYLQNPYLGKHEMTSVGADGTLVQIINMPSAHTFGPEKYREEGKREVADQEKLLVFVTGWTFKSVVANKPKRIWRAVLYIDDPNHRDLNRYANSMVAVGSAYFDRNSKEKETFLNVPLPEGRVKVGTAKVTEMPATEKK